jgi:hypothetical protein
MHWMIRKPNVQPFQLCRPLSQLELIGKIENGELKPDDEVCPSQAEQDSYWFALRETQEILKHLGEIKLDRLFARTHDREDTATTLAGLSDRTKILSEVKMDRASILPENTKMNADGETQHRVKKIIALMVVFSALLFGLISFWLRRY